VARELGILRKGVLITGAELSALGDTDFRAAVDHIEVYARVAPAHKLRIVRMLQQQGQVVAMTGAGVDDASALRQADVGIALGIGGTDAAREAADMLLTDNGFASIVTAVGEGRSIINTIRKCLMYLLSCNIGQMGLLAATMALGLPLPLNAAQVLYLNLVAGCVLAAGLAVAPGKDTLMRQAPGNPDEALFTRPVIGRVLTGGLWSALTSLAVFAGVLYNGRPLAEATTLSVVTLTLMQLLNAYRLASYQTPSSGTR
jgi:Ca2+-transporting ATPase